MHNLVLFAIGCVPGLDVPAGGLPAAKQIKRRNKLAAGSKRRRQVHAGERGPPAWQRRGHMGSAGGHVTACGMTTFSEIWQSSPLDGRFLSAIFAKFFCFFAFLRYLQIPYIFKVSSGICRVEVKFVRVARGQE